MASFGLHSRLRDPRPMSYRYRSPGLDGLPATSAHVLPSELPEAEITSRAAGVSSVTSSLAMFTRTRYPAPCRAAVANTDVPSVEKATGIEPPPRGGC